MGGAPSCTLCREARLPASLINILSLLTEQAGPRKVPAASDPTEHPFLPGQKEVAGWGAGGVRSPDS